MQTEKSKQEQILRRVIQKAIINGWNVFGSNSGPESGEIVVRGNGQIQFWRENYEPVDIETILFDHHFARALWGTNLVCQLCLSEYEVILADAKFQCVTHEGKVMPRWEVFLQLLAITNNRIEFLEPFAR